jgi:hypothetical protein
MVAETMTMADPRITQVLVEAASTDLDAKSRAQAVETLWRHVGYLRFADATSVDALKQLAEDSDANVSTIARRALQDMQQYLQGDSAL